MEGLIVLIWHIMANGDGDEDADGDSCRPEKKKILWNIPMLMVTITVPMMSNRR